MRKHNLSDCSATLFPLFYHWTSFRYAAHLMKSVVHICYMSLKINRKILLASWLINEMLLSVRKLDNYSYTMKVLLSLDNHRTDFSLSCPTWKACTCWASSSGQKVGVGWNKVMGLRRAESRRSCVAFIILCNLSDIPSV